MKETPIIKKILMERSAAGARLFRNNTGQAWQGEQTRTAAGLLITNPRPVKFGLCEGSSDLIGWTPYRITAADLGKTVAIFTAIEVKTGRTQTTPAQANFIEQVKKAGGIGEIIREGK